MDETVVKSYITLTTVGAPTLGDVDELFSGHELRQWVVHVARAVGPATALVKTDAVKADGPTVEEGGYVCPVKDTRALAAFARVDPVVLRV